MTLLTLPHFHWFLPAIVCAPLFRRVAAISTPIFFVATSLALAEVLRLLRPARSALMKLIAEVTLVWLPFADNSRARFSAQSKRPRDPG